MVETYVVAVNCSTKEEGIEVIKVTVRVFEICTNAPTLKVQWKCLPVQHQGMVPFWETYGSSRKPHKWRSSFYGERRSRLDKGQE